MMTFLVLLLCGGLVAWADRLHFHGHKVYDVTPTSPQQVGFIKEFLHTYPEIDVWTDHFRSGDHVIIHVTPEQEFLLYSFLRVHGLAFGVKVDDLEAVVDAQVTLRARRPQSAKNFAFDEYHTLDEIEAYIENVTSLSPLAESHLAGSSYEGRDIIVVKLSTDHSANRPIVWMDGGIHAREWVSQATMLFFIDHFVTNYGNDDVITRLLDNMDFYILPVFNVDGYSYTWTDNRLWRKTRSPNNGSTCVGCDPNRNFDFHWGEVGVSPNPCTETYPGSSPFSEVEVRSVMEYVRALPDVQAYLAYHSFGQFYMLPYGFTDEPIDEYDELMSVLQGATNAITEVNGLTYRYDSLINLVGPNSGSSADYTYGVLNIKYSMGVELRDLGEHGFLLPADQILPNAEENLAALLHIAQYVLDNPTRHKTIL